MYHPRYFLAALEKKHFLVVLLPLCGMRAGPSTCCFAAHLDMLGYFQYRSLKALRTFLINRVFLDTERKPLCRPAGALPLSLTLPTAYAGGLNNFAPSGLGCCGSKLILISLSERYWGYFLSAPPGLLSLSKTLLPLPEFVVFLLQGLRRARLAACYLLFQC